MEYSAELPESVMSEFEIGKIYSRRTDIHARFGGQQQGGISTPASAPIICSAANPESSTGTKMDGLKRTSFFIPVKGRTATWRLKAAIKPSGTMP